LELPDLLYGCETWENREKDKYRIISWEMELMRTTAKHTWQNYKTNEYILSEINVKPVAKKTHNYRNKWIQRFLRMDRDRLAQLVV
jgi:hypothetical protein